MKRFFILLFLNLVLTVSCISLAPEGNDDSPVTCSLPIVVRSNSAIEPIDSYYVSQEMAELFITSQKGSQPITSIEPYGIGGIICLYVINFEEGYVIVAADTRVQPILAECEEGNLSPGKTDNPGVKVWLEDTADRIRVLKQLNPKVKEDYSDLWLPFLPHKDSSCQTRMEVDSIWVGIDYLWISVAESDMQYLYFHSNQPALMTTKWGQGVPWNATMPYDYNHPNDRCLTGCAAVAVSQVLRYYNRTGSYPTALWHSVSVSNTTQCLPDYPGYVKTTLSRSGYTSPSSHWNGMPDTKYGYNTYYVSCLMLDIGNRIETHYSRDDSFVEGDTNYTIPNLSLCGISSWFGPFDFTEVSTDINTMQPVIVSAICPLGGHVWVIDGSHDYSRDYITTLTYYHVSPEDLDSYSNIVGYYSEDEMAVMNPNAYNGMQTVSHSIHTMKDLHMNWGWDGNGDGYYNMLVSDDWIVSPGNISLNFLYTRNIHYNILTSQLN